MKLIPILCLSLLIFTGCHKDENVAPTSNNKSSTAGGSTKTQTGGSGQTAPDTTPALSHDDSIHMTKFAVKPQAVKLSVTGTTLTMVFNENVNILLTEEGYQKTYGVLLVEDFSKTMLSGFDYTTVAQGGNITLDWVDDNLNNVIDKTISDTLINKQKMVKINVHRPFTFSKTYSSEQDAQTEEAAFAAKTTDTVGFSSYCFYNHTYYRPTSTSAVVVYSK